MGWNWGSNGKTVTELAMVEAETTRIYMNITRIWAEKDHLVAIRLQQEYEEFEE